MQCIRCGKEMISSSGRYDYCTNCQTWQPSNCDMPLTQGFGKQEGWICPVCGRGVAPWMNWCPCQSDGKITYGTSTGGDVDLSEYQDMMNRIQKALEDGEIKL